MRLISRLRYCKKPRLPRGVIARVVAPRLDEVTIWQSSFHVMHHTIFFSTDEGQYYYYALHFERMKKLIKIFHCIPIPPPPLPSWDSHLAGGTWYRLTDEGVSGKRFVQLHSSL